MNNAEMLTLVVVSVVAILALAAALGIAYQVPVRPEAEVGPWRWPPKREPARPRLPNHYTSSLHAEAVQWRSQSQWGQLCKRLDAIERDLGRTPELAPEEFDEFWLQQRIASLEALAGPMPFEHVTVAAPPPPPTFWDRLVASFSRTSPLDPTRKASHHAS